MGDTILVWQLPIPLNSNTPSDADKKSQSKNTDKPIMKRSGLLGPSWTQTWEWKWKKIKRAWVGDEAVCQQQLRRFRT